MSRLCVFASALALVSSILSGCTRSADPPPRPPRLPAVMVMHPQRGEAVRTITLPGDLVGYYESTLYAKVTGYLQSISVDKGSWVKAGQVLAVIEVPELNERLQEARADFEIKRITYRRIEQVWKTDPKLVARQNVDVAYGKFREAQAQVDELEAMASYTRIVAPFNGVITGRFVDPGALIKAGGGQNSAGLFPINPNESSTHPAGGVTPVVSEAMIKKLRVYVYIPQDSVSMIHRGTPAALTIANFPGRTFHGKVTRFAHSLDLTTRTMLTEVDIENPRHELYPGMYAHITLDLEIHPNAIKLPDLAIATSSHGSFVYVVKDGQLAKTPVSTGINNGQTVEITHGLTGNEEVVSDINPMLPPGERVRAVMTDSAGSTGVLADIR
jgi:membrane fusion protein, multidrug efflux system